MLHRAIGRDDDTATRFAYAELQAVTVKVVTCDTDAYPPSRWRGAWQPESGRYCRVHRIQEIDHEHAYSAGDRLSGGAA